MLYRAETLAGWYCTAVGRENVVTVVSVTYHCVSDIIDYPNAVQTNSTSICLVVLKQPILGAATPPKMNVFAQIGDWLRQNGDKVAGTIAR